jgi:hypothetical protein
MSSKVRVFFREALSAIDDVKSTFSDRPAGLDVFLRMMGLLLEPNRKFVLYLGAGDVERERKRDRQFVRRAFYSDEGICPQEFDHTQRVVARFSGDVFLPLAGGNASRPSR